MKPNTPASSRQLSSSLLYWVEHHGQCMRTSLQRLLTNPLATLVTVLMIAIAFVIPSIIFTFFNSASDVVNNWNASKQVTLFLKDDIKLPQAEALSEQLNKQAHLTQVQVISRDQALAEFKQQTDLGPVIENLSANPLPHILIANLEDTVIDLTTMQDLKSNLIQLSEVEHIELDLLWIQRTQAMLGIFFKVLWITCVLLSAAIALIIINVIRWEVSSRAEELEIMRLLGGTDAYVRRPFLYTGFWIGFIGAVIAVIFTVLCIALLQTNMAILSQLFSNDYQLTSLKFKHIAFLVCLGGLFGICGAWFASMQRLQRHS